MNAPASASLRHETLAALAAFLKLSPSEAIWVASTLGVFTASARSSEKRGRVWTEAAMAAELFESKPLAAYFVEVIRKANAADPQAVGA